MYDLKDQDTEKKNCSSKTLYQDSTGSKKNIIIVVKSQPIRNVYENLRHCYLLFIFTLY